MGVLLYQSRIEEAVKVGPIPRLKSESCKMGGVHS